DWWYYLPYLRLAGGGILCDSPYSYDHNASQNGSSPTLSYLIIQGNTAEMGAGLCAWKNSHPIIENTIVRNNVASNGGGGLYFIEAFNTGGPAITLTNVEVTHNTGGIEGACGIAANFTSKVNMMNCTVADNSGAVANGEALWRANGAYFEIYNSIFWNLTTDLIHDEGGSPATSTIDYCDVTNQLGDLVAGGNMILTDPLFLNSAGNDYHLSSLSPCIDAGTVAGAPSSDLDGNKRNAIPDMGAYENTSVGIQELPWQALSIFPNPAQNEISIINSKRFNEIKLFDAEGRLIYTVNLFPFENTKINLADLNRGCYFISADNFYQKIVKL
ncbi:MAG: T9SS type A sorting domain-containing protein, partial [Bacteroidota bacterium]